MSNLQLVASPREYIPTLKSGLDDPQAVDILTTEHWSLLSTRTLGYQEMFGRTTVFIAALSGTVVALALLAEATNFGRLTLWLALLLLLVVLFIGLQTFVRSLAINYEDARCVTGMNLLRNAYLQMVPELERFFITGHRPRTDPTPLGYGSRQRLANLASSLTTTSSVVAALDSVLAGALAADVAALARTGTTVAVVLGLGVSVVSGAGHVAHAARFRRHHRPSQPASD